MNVIIDVGQAPLALGDGYRIDADIPGGLKVGKPATGTVKLIAASGAPVPGVVISLEAKGANALPVYVGSLRPDADGRSVTWTGSARLGGQFGPSDVTFLGPYQGPWAIFRLFHQAERLWDDPKLLTFFPKDDLVRFRRPTRYFEDDVYSEEEWR